MVAWVVIDRRHPRQSRNPSRPFPFSFLLDRRLNIWTLRRSDAPFHLPYPLPSAVSRNSICLPLLRKLPGCVPTIPILERICTERSRGPLPLAALHKFFFFTFLRTLLLFFVPSKNSTYLFSNASALFAKNNPEFGRGAHLNWLSSTSSDKIPSLPTPDRQMARQTRNHHV